MTVTFSTSMTVPPARSERPLSGDHAADGAHQLLGLLVWVARTSVASDEAMSDVPVPRSEADLVERSLGGVDLRHDVDAVAILLDLWGTKTEALFLGGRCESHLTCAPARALNVGGHGRG
jgi:hypothetical protein